MEKKIDIVSFRIPSSLRQALDEAQWTLRKRKSEIVREAITEYLKNHCPEVYEEFLKGEEGEGKG